ncbi:mannosyltransferase [Purpureocillium takamizusanense]|uniref:Mannosyltransferase n=1 Tax=Purpureocillium takamizusanense TaxID=2060973 RepID=A0A9Q8QTV5_9HYPO|nr:mannosyltransferase [Purpureocillium takamizusanense]UNI24614.1 mannosyltransferase [Purpureocillium takamizusanense]
MTILRLPSLMRAAALVLAAASALVPLASSAVANPNPELAKRDDDTKYFHEPWGSLALGHYDLRYFKEEVPYEQHTAVLRDLIRSYLTVMDAAGAETWIAHGTLLGWWWNGQIMPWDYDLDVQVSNATLQWMGDHLNRTEHSFNSSSSPGSVSKYVLDVNPHHSDIDQGDGMNIIDARWIDMQNGMFVDITGVREREVDRPGFWSCKNFHHYASQDLWPLRRTEFEGVRALVPYSFEQILVDEYGAKSLVTEEHESHRWDRDIKQWVRMDAEDERRAKEEARERKRLEMIRDGRLNTNP